MARRRVWEEHKHPRDSRGRFASWTGGSISDAWAERVVAQLEGRQSSAPRSRVDLAAEVASNQMLHPSAAKRDPFDGVPTGRSAYQAVRHSDDWEDESGLLSQAISNYVGNNYEEMNEVLRTGRSSDWGNTDDQVRALSARLRRSKLRQDIVVHRGVFVGKYAFGRAWSDGDMTGVEWVERGFSSTTAREDIAHKFVFGEAANTDLVSVAMRVKVPAGVGGARVGHWDEAEVLLQPGLRFRVVADHGIEGRVRRMDVEVVGDETD